MIIEFKCEVESCRLVETWRVEAPDPREHHDIREFLYAAMSDGRAEFVEQKVSEEGDRTIISLEAFVPEGLPAS